MPARVAVQRGFTMIEIFIALIVAAIVAAISVPAMRDFSLQQRLSTVAQDLQLDLALARSEAVTRSDNISVCTSNNQTNCTNTAWTGGRIIFVDSNQNGALDGADVLIREGNSPPAGISVTTSVAAGFVSFNSRGAVNAQRVFTVCRTGLVGRDLTLRTTGHPTIAKTAGACP